jgi:hypothetical protein
LWASRGLQPPRQGNPKQLQHQWQQVQALQKARGCQRRQQLEQEEKEGQTGCLAPALQANRNRRQQQPWSWR